MASDAFVQVVREVGATGWDTYPIEIQLSKGRVLGGYHGFVVTGRCREIVPVNTSRTYLDDYGERVYRGVDPTPGWDGSDVFWLGPHFEFAVTGRVWQALQAPGADDLAAVRAEDYEEPADETTLAPPT